MKRLRTGETPELRRARRSHRRAFPILLPLCVLRVLCDFPISGLPDPNLVPASCPHDTSRYSLTFLSKRVAILGSTGSIGCNALDVVQHLGHPYRAVALSGNSNLDKLSEQVARCRPAAVGVPETAAQLARQRWSDTTVYVGPEGLCEMVGRDDVDIVLSAIVGAAGLPVALAAVEAGKTLALANKESLVVAGSLLVPRARERGVNILPVDSEHSAIFQALLAGRLQDVKRVILTASGGPFRTWSIDRIHRATLSDALAHPTWSMGKKITIDSATMFNKGLELIEAVWLFDLKPEQVQIMVHPESVVHSMVEFVDGSVIAQLSPPDMKTPIQYALTYPERAPGCGRTMNWTDAFALTFEPPDVEKFPALRLAYDVARRGGIMGAVLNASNEVAVEAFIGGRIGFTGITRVVERTIDRAPVMNSPSLADLLEADAWARRVTLEETERQSP